MILLYIVFALFIVLLVWYSFVFEPYNLKVERLTIELKNLPQSFKGVKIIHISDIHTKRFGRKEKAVLTIIKQLNFDYLVLTGDIIDRKTKYLAQCRPFWQELGKQYQGKIFAIFGNHLHGNIFINVHEFKDFLQRCNIKTLINKNIKLKKGNEHIYVVGVDDPHTKHHNLKRALKGIENNTVKILLAHSSEIMQDLSEGKVDLILSGHTHGGQVKFPFIRPFWNPTIYRGKYNRGLFKIKDYFLYVNRGIGTDILPIRFNSSPEITLITLKKSNLNV